MASAQIKKRTIRAKKAEIALDTVSRKRGRGRPANMRFSEIRGRADNFRGIFDQVWERFWPLFSQAETEEETVRAFEEGANPYQMNFVPFAALALRIRREKKFPKTRPAQTKFLADSLGALGVVSPRRSRDICEQERQRAERETYIIRSEYYIVCSCGYKGPSLKHACPKCEAHIPGGLFEVDIFDQT